MDALLPQAYLIGLIVLLGVAAIVVARQIWRVRADEVTLAKLERKDSAKPSDAASLYELGSVQLRKRLYGQAAESLKQALKKAEAEKEPAEAQAVIQNLGRLPQHFKPAQYAGDKPLHLKPYRRATPKTKTLVGVDLFVHWGGSNPEELGQWLHGLDAQALKLKMITNRGIKVYPGGFPETFCTDHWRCRFVGPDGAAVAKADVIALLQRAEASGVDFIKTEHLYVFDGVKAFSLGQGE